MNNDHANEVHVEMDAVDIARLVADGVLREVHLPSGRTVYEMVDISRFLPRVDQ